MTALRFNMDDLRPIIAHSEASKTHTAPYGIGKPVPGLFLVKDSGIYLMSNGETGLLRADNKPGQHSQVVVYAIGYKPDGADSYEKCRNAVGGDDFAELLPLAWFTKARDLGAVSVTVNFGKTRVGFSYALPKTNAPNAPRPTQAPTAPGDSTKAQAAQWVDQEFSKVNWKNSGERLASERRMIEFIQKGGITRPNSYAAHVKLASMIEHNFPQKRQAGGAA